MQLTESRLQLIDRRLHRSLGRRQIRVLGSQLEVHGRSLGIQLFQCLVDLLQLRVRLIDLRDNLIQRSRVDPQCLQLTLNLRSHDRIIFILFILFIQRLDGRSVLFQRHQLIPAFLQLGLRGRQLLCSLRLTVLDRLLAVLDLLLAALCSRHAALHLAFRIAHLLVDGRSNLFIDRIDLVLRQDDLYIIVNHTHGGNRSDTLDALQRTLQIILCKLRHLARRLVLHTDRRRHHRHHVHADLHHHRRPRRVRQISLDLIDLFPDVHRHRIHVDAVRKLQLDHGIIGRRHRRDILDIGKRRHLLLHRLGNLFLRLLRAGSRIRCHDDDIRRVDFRKQVRRHLRQGDHPEHDHDDHRDQYGEWLLNAEL